MKPSGRFRPVSAALLGLALLLASAASAGAQVKDAVLWKGITLNFKLSKKLRVSIRDQVRMESNFSIFQQNLMELGLRIEATKYLNITPGYRYSIRPEFNSSRIYVDLEAGKRIKRWRLTPEGRLRLLHNMFRDNLNETYIRPRIMASYNVKGIKLDPYAGMELFYRIDAAEREFDRYRLMAGLGYSFNKKVDLKAQYTFQQEFNIIAPVQSHIWILQWSVQLD